MHLINPLVAGIRGAEIGSVELLERGTSTHAVYYKDFPATQQYSAQPIPLDSFGSATIYVDELVDVLVHDQNGVLVREFVAGDYAAAVEVISQSFTGTDYRDGTVGPFKPTNLASVLDLWKTNAGSVDWKILVGGVSITIGDALSSFAALYYNVKSYGALGNGVADDGAAITAAIAAAAVAGGTVFFPPGVYRTTVTIVVPVNVCLLGSGASATKLAIHNAATFCTRYPGSDTGTRTVRNMWFGSINVNTTQPLALVDGAGARVLFEDCMFGNDSTTKGTHASINNTTLDSLTLFNRCQFYEMAGSTIIFCPPAPAGGRATLRDCDLKSLFTGSTSNAHVQVSDGVMIDNCRFDASALAAGTFAYIQLGIPGQFGGNAFVNNRFKSGVGVVAAFRSGNTQPPGFWESGNFFGDTSGAMPGYKVEGDEGYAPLQTDVGGLRSHISRENRSWGTTDPGGPVAVDARSYGLIVIRRSIAGSQPISANLGSFGDRLTVCILNNTGGALSPTFGTGFTTLAAGFTSIPIGGKGLYQFMFLPPTASGIVGSWVIISQAVAN